MGTIETTVSLNGRLYILRMDGTTVEVDRCLESLRYLDTRLSTILGETQPVERTTEQSSPKPASIVGRGSIDAPSEEEESGVLHITKLKITGDEDKPKVEMYTPNTRLSYPVIYGNSQLVESIIRSSYPDIGDLSSLHKCGKKYDVDWSVSWRRSDKTSNGGRRYLNISSITLNKERK